ncbi:methyl-accepting chemotaxis protein [Robertmurraya andreesenii]|uniref:Methyl-accepting chemotaxis protein n=1 Tax=Anoxybacillus andreesenii TaxID=1325932 RepID=A0ABT9V5T6_9BACL|nr:HAMP domain-containing methyl-accepting chemotaxis protein [Robertmurraya andreesenii]MDQ0156306.1 methyl-accepting chemotaxis protein [Robertmurraya andreesenii]
MKKSITTQLGVIIIIVLFVSMMITSASNFWVSYQKTYEAAGIEAVGCANITTGLINPSDIEEIARGNQEKLKELQQNLNWTTDHKQIFETQYILSLDGTIIAADRHLQEQGFKAGDSFYIDRKAIALLQETKHAQFSEIYEFGGMKRLSGYAPIYKDHDPNKEIIAINVIDFNAKIVIERTWASVMDSFVLGLLPMIIAGFITIWLIRRKTRPITTLIEYSKQIAEGDLAVENVSVPNKDEIGDLATTLNTMKGNLRKLIEQVSDNAVHLAASSKQLTAGAEQTNEATEQIVNTMHQMAISVEGHVQSVDDTTGIIHEMSHGIQQIASNAKEVSTSANHASDRASQGGKSIETAIQQMQLINKTVSELEEVIHRLDTRSKEVGQIVDVITGISKQTNLLALNAAIEAARAGESGKGFSIVADEVRKLAEQSAQSAKEISQLIAETQEETNLAVRSMAFVAEEVDTGIGIVSLAGSSFEEIKDSVNAVTNQIQGVSAAVQQMAVGASQIVHSMENISAVADTAAASTQKVSTSTEEQLAFMEEITSSSSYLSTLAEELQLLIGRFKIS